MQPLAIGALATTVVMIIGAAGTLFLTRKNRTHGPAAIGRWNAVSRTRQQRGSSRA